MRHRQKKQQDSHPALDRDFQWGAYFSAHGLEGGDFHSDWWRWEQRPGRIADGAVSDPAANHWTHYAADYRLAARFGMQNLLIGISWARIQPTPDTFDEAALTHYAQRLQAVRDAGMTPWVLPLEYVLPAWLTHRGGLAASHFQEAYCGYLARLLAVLAPYATHWIPCWQPGFLLKRVYETRQWPGGTGNRVQRFWRYRNALQNLRACVQAAHTHIKTASPESQVGAAIRLDAAQPHDPHSPWDFTACQRYQRQLLLPYRSAGKATATPPPDFLVAACYGRQRIRYAPFGWPFTAACCDLDGWLVAPDVVYPDPEALVSVLPTCTDFGVPLYLMSGLATDDDASRHAYLLALWRLVAAYREQGVKIDGFLHHSLLDGFEGRHGHAARYGLIHVDPRSQARTPNPSALLQEEIANNAQAR